MMEEIFLAVGDALVYLAGPMHKKYSTTIAWGYPFYARILGPIFQPPSHICIEQYDANATGE